MRTWWMLLVMTSCEGFTLDLACPTGPLSEGDLPCTCQGQVAEALSCGTLTCTSAGLEIGTSSGCTSKSDTGLR